MAGIQYVHSDDVEWRLGTQKPGIDGGANPDVHFKPLFGGESMPLRAQLCEYEPGHYEPAHSHPTSEVLYVLQGSLTVGDQEFTAGAALFVAAGTTYGPLTGGDDGTLFMRVDTAS
jgi:quercetin dioxygenase-like cupin family protein